MWRSPYKALCQTFLFPQLHRAFLHTHFPQDAQAHRYGQQKSGNIGDRLAALNSSQAENRRENQQSRQHEKALTRHCEHCSLRGLANRLQHHIIKDDPTVKREGQALKAKRRSANFDHRRIIAKKRNNLRRINKAYSGDKRSTAVATRMQNQKALRTRP